LIETKLFKETKMAKIRYDVVVIDECGDEQIYGSNYPSEIDAKKALNEIFENNSEFYGGWVEPNARSLYEQEWQDRFDNDEADLY
jgi:hypothetical protein